MQQSDQQCFFSRLFPLRNEFKMQISSFYEFQLL